MSDDKSGGPPGFDMNALLGQVMEQAKTVQDRVSQTTEKVKTMTAEGSAGGGLVVSFHHRSRSRSTALQQAVRR